MRTILNCLLPALLLASSPTAAQDTGPADYVGSSACTDCHEDAPADWFAISADPRAVACYWAEKAEADGEEIDVIRARLMTLRDLLAGQSLL